jgi:hypothetical protein
MTESSIIGQAWSTCLEDVVCGCLLSWEVSDVQRSCRLTALPRGSPFPSG